MAVLERSGQSVLDDSEAVTASKFVPPVLIPRAGLYTPFEERRVDLPRPDYEFPIQQRIASEWASLFGNDFDPSINVSEFMRKKDEISGGLALADLKRNMAYLKLTAVSLATSYGLDIYKTVEQKLMVKMQRKYPPEAFTELRLLGYSIEGARAILKGLFEIGESYQYQGVEIPEEEQKAREPREEPFPDPIQDMIDAWQRAAFGSDLVASDRTPVVLAEADELLEEFDELTADQIDSITDIEKLKERIGGEIADVIIAVDGFFASEDTDVVRWQNFALNRMIDTYGDLPRLRRLGVPTQVAMEYLRECRFRDENNLARPISPVPAYNGPVFRVLTKVPIEPSFSSEATR